MAWVYKNSAKDENEYAKDGWDLFPIQLSGGSIIAFKDIDIPFEDEIVQSLIKQYDSEGFQKIALSIPRLRKYYDGIGFRFAEVSSDSEIGKKMRLSIDEATKKKLSTWRVEMDFSDGYLRLSPFDMAYPYSFYNRKVLDRYAPEIVSSLRKKGLVKCATISS